jgi:hypothetical protein
MLSVRLWSDHGRLRNYRTSSGLLFADYSRVRGAVAGCIERAFFGQTHVCACWNVYNHAVDVQRNHILRSASMMHNQCPCRLERRSQVTFMAMKLTCYRNSLKGWISAFSTGERCGA